MRENTPPSSPHQSDMNELEDEEDIDLGDIEEVIELVEEVGSIGGEEDGEEMEELEDVVDMAHKVFSQHKGSVFACSAASSGLVVTGGEDDLAYVWDSNDASVRFTCTGHKDSVTCVEFSHDGSLVATADMSGYIQVWKVSSSTKIWDFEIGDLNWLSWHHGSNVLLAGTSEGEVWMWLVPQGNARTFPSFGSASACGAFLPDGKRAISGYEDGSLRVFDLKSGEVKHQLCDGLAHSAPVTSISAHKDNTLAISGSMDGTAKLFNTLNGKVIGTLNCDVKPKSEEDDDGETSDNTVEAVAFCPTIPNIAMTSSLSGFIIIWDITTQVIRHTIDQGCGNCQLFSHPIDPLLFAGGLDGSVRSYDVRSGNLLKTFTGHHSSIFYMSIDKENSTIVTASDDGTSRIFKFGDS